MKGSIITVSFFVVGLLLSYFDLNLAFLNEGDFASWVLYLLMFTVGVSIGWDKSILKSIASSNWRILLLPLATIVGTLGGAAIISLFMEDRSLSDALAVGSGFGYYSLSSIFITEYKGAELGTVALTSNVLREIITLLFAPLMVRWFTVFAPITSGGATTIDTTLPVIMKYSGREWVIVAITHGVLVDLSVPFLVTLFCTW